MPILYVIADDWSSVAAHDQAETMPQAMSPGLTLCEAELNSSAFFGLESE